MATIKRMHWPKQLIDGLPILNIKGLRRKGRQGPSDLIPAAAQQQQGNGVTRADGEEAEAKIASPSWWESPELIEAKRLPEQTSKEQNMLSQQYEDNISRLKTDLAALNMQLRCLREQSEQAFEQSQFKQTEAAQQLQASQHAAQEALTAQITAEQKLDTAQQDTEQKLRQQSHELHQRIRSAKQSAERDSKEKLQVMQAEFEQKLAAAMSDADQQMEEARADMHHQLHEARCASQQLQQQQQQEVDVLQHQMDAQLQTDMDAALQRLQAEHEEAQKQLQQQLQARSQEVQDVQAEKVSLEQQFESALADSAQDMQDLRDSFISSLEADRSQHSSQLEESQKAHKKAAEHHQIEVAELQAALERQQDLAAQREHEALDRHMAGMAAKDMMVQQMWGELHDRKQDCARFEVEARELSVELRCTLGQLAKSEADTKEWKGLHHRLIEDKMNLVNQRHFLYNRIAWLEGRPTYLQGQQHQWQVVPPPGHPPAHGGHPSPDGGHFSPDKDHPSPEETYPSPDGARHPYDEPSPSPDGAHHPIDEPYPSPDEAHPFDDAGHVCYHEPHTPLADFPSDNVSAQAGHESPHPPSPDSHELAPHQPTPLVDYPDSEASGDDSAAGQHSDEYGDIEAAYDSDTNHDARSFATQASDLVDLEAGDGARSDPVSSKTMSLNDTGITAFPATDSAAGGEEQDVYEEEADPEIESAAIVYDEVEDTSSGETGHHKHTAAVLADHADTLGTDASLSSIADASGTAAVPNNSGRDAVSPSPRADTAEEATDCCTTEDSIAIKTPAETPDGEEDEQALVGRDGVWGEHEEGVVAQLEDRVKALQEEVQELHGIARGWQDGYIELEADHDQLKEQHALVTKEYSELQKDASELVAAHTHTWTDALALQMVAWDATTRSLQPLGPRPRVTPSPQTGMSVDVTHIKIIQHRLFNLMDSDRDGVFSEEDMVTWVNSHIRMGTVARQDILRSMTDGGNREAEQIHRADWQLCEWLVEKVWGVLTEMFAPNSHESSWKGFSASDFLKAELGHAVGALLCSPLEFWEDQAGVCTHCVGSRYIRWGPMVQENCCELDVTADAYHCFDRS